jgi:hypothetical protein
MWSTLYEAIISRPNKWEGVSFLHWSFILPLLCNTINFVGLYVVQCPQARGIHDLWWNLARNLAKSLKFTLEKQHSPKNSQFLCQNNVQLEVSWKLKASFKLGVRDEKTRGQLWGHFQLVVWPQVTNKC